MGVISHRGKVWPNELVHFKVLGDGKIQDHPLCNNGAYGIAWTECVKAVTCPICKERLLKTRGIK